MTKRNTSNYPIELITSYRAGKICRQQFIKQFRDWQKSHGINYDCKGTADRQGVHVEYRGTTATIRDGKLSFITGDNCEPNSPTHFLWHEANSVFEFKRKVDFSKNDYPILTVDQQKTLFEIMRARNESK